MIKLTLIGGLGNQLFQVAFAYALSKKYNQKIYIDLSKYKNYKIRKYRLEKFRISKLLFDLNESKFNNFNLLKLNLSELIYRIFQKVIKTISSKDYLGQKFYIFLSNRGLLYNFDPYFYNTGELATDYMDIYGYFQSEKYFLNYKNDLLSLLSPISKESESEKSIIKKINSMNSCGITLRLGDDYLKSKNLNVCDESYYLTAIKYMKEKEPDVNFYIFSDNISRAKKMLGLNSGYNYIDGFKDYEQLRILYNCRNFIISNSSFSWWGSYLSRNDKKKIIAPKKWFKNSSKKPDIYNDKMILL